MGSQVFRDKYPADPQHSAGNSPGECEDRLRIAMEVAQMGYWEWEIQGNRVIWEPDSNRVLGIDPKQTEGQFEEFLGHVYPADFPRIAEELSAARRGEADFVAEFRVIRVDGALRWMAGFGRSIRNSSGAVVRVVGLVRDITERKEAEEAVARKHAELTLALQEALAAREQAENAARAKDHFLAVLSHELRTPLTPVLVAIHTLQMMPDLPPEVLDTVDMIRRNVQLEARLIDDLLELTRIRHNKLDLQFALIDIHQTLQRAIEICDSDFKGKQQHLEVELLATKYLVNGDGKRLLQVFWNLLKNASKFTPRQGVLRVRTFNATPDRLTLEVADSGIGIAREALPKIFDAFAQADVSITKRFGGLGLGLAISKVTVDAHGGTIHAKSDGDGHGATFTVELNISESPPSFLL